MKAEHYFATKLRQLKSDNLLREPCIYEKIYHKNKKFFFDKNQDNLKLISFADNDYLNLVDCNKIKKVAIKAIEKYGVGAGSSRYITGNNIFYQKIEEKIAKMKNRQASLLFSSGYSVAVGVIPALVSRGDLIIADRLIHSCLIDGAKLSGAKMIRFAHNDMINCENILMQNRHLFTRCLIISESIFSMDGDVGKINDLWSLAKKFNCGLLIDEAHSFGVKDFTISKQDLQVKNSAFYLQIGTLSKAVGAIGGYVAGDKVAVKYLKNFAKTAIYSTALPPAILASINESLKIIAKGDRAFKAWRNVDYFCELMNLPKSQSLIVPILVGDNKKALDIANYVKNQGFIISAIRPPTVPVGKARLRIAFCSNHLKKDVERLVKIVKKAFKISG
ncbi:MAG: aminotransferase class I/II-fold pyridoxal phosphate-dependent enzyme [Rickettsiales bacterium]|nr:aminotransferase class I/II-fold pyridoxal phosphate-dependent enzyme [Rickettsiales bacterium]